MSVADGDRRTRTILAAGGILLCTLLCHLDAVAAEPAPSAAVRDTADARCRELRNFAAPGLRIDDVRLLPVGAVTGRVPGEAVALPEHCLFQGTLEPRTGPDG